VTYTWQALDNTRAHIQAADMSPFQGCLVGVFNRWAMPIAGVCRPFRAGLSLSFNRWDAYCRCMSPFQGCLVDVLLTDGRCPSRVDAALSGLGCR